MDPDSIRSANPDWESGSRPKLTPKKGNNETISCLKRPKVLCGGLKRNMTVLSKKTNFPIIHIANYLDPDPDSASTDMKHC